MLNPSARDTQIVSVSRIWHFLEYCCPNRANHAVHESLLQRQLLVIQQLSSETFIQFGGRGAAKSKSWKANRANCNSNQVLTLSECLPPCTARFSLFPYITTSYFCCPVSLAWQTSLQSTYKMYQTLSNPIIAHLHPVFQAC